MPIFDDHINLTQHEIRNSVLQNLAADPTSPTPVKGQKYFNTVTNRTRTFNGSTWDEDGSGDGDVTQASNSGSSGRIKVSAGADKSIEDLSGINGLIKTDVDGIPSLASPGTDYLTASSTNTLTNKTFDANDTGNTLSNVETADFATGVINTSGTLTGATNSQIPSALATKTYADSLLASNDAMVFKGGIDASTNPNYPAADAGDTYKITVAGKIGGASGIDVTIGDTLYCTVDSTSSGDQATVGNNWTIVQSNVDIADTSTPGIISLATDAEAKAGTVNNKAVTPLAIADFSIVQEFTFGDGIETSFTLTHNRNSKAVITQVRDASTDEIRFPKIVNTTLDTVTISGYITAPSTNSMKAVVIG